MLAKVFKMIITILILIALAMTVLFIIKGRASKTGAAIGLQSSLLAACPNKPNCVCSETGTPSSHAVNGLSFSGGADVAWEQALAAISATGGQIENNSDGYAAATYQSALFGFVDDLELRLDEANNMIQIRSASREGHSDLGANKKRVAAVRSAFDGTRENN